jgi:hypothetical protein
MAHGPCDVTPQPNPLKATVHVSIPGAAEGEVRSDNYLCRRGRPKVAVAFNRNRPGSLASPPSAALRLGEHLGLAGGFFVAPHGERGRNWISEQFKRLNQTDACIGALQTN